MRNFLPFFCLVLGCAGARPPEANAPGAPAASATAGAEPAAAPGAKPIEPAAVPPPPPECGVFVQHATSACGPTGAAREAFAAALAQRDAAERDRALACLEETSEFPKGLVRALRADLAPEACADALAVPFLEKPPQKLAREIEAALLGLVVSGRLARLLGSPPALGAPFSKQRFRSFLGDELKPWMVSQALAIDELSLQGSRLAGYGRGVAAIAAGNADLRFVDTVRNVPLPEEMRADKELTDAYYGSLDQALEPRKQRGRDAALVGLRAFAELGSVRDERVERARTLLSKLFLGSRVDALDALYLPALPDADTASTERKLAALLPTFYAAQVMTGADAADPKLLRAFLERGIPKPVRDKLDAKKLGAPARYLLGYAYVDSGIRYFRAADFQRAREVLESGKPDEAGQLLVAVSVALERGPEDVAHLMLRGPGAKGALDVSALDALAKQKTRIAGLAGFDAAYLLGLVPKQGDAAFWEDLAARFERAEKLLQGAALVKKSESGRPNRAHEYAEAARATAAALRKNP